MNLIDGWHGKSSSVDQILNTFMNKLPIALHTLYAELF